MYGCESWSRKKAEHSVCGSFLSSSWSMGNVSHAGANSSVGTVGYLFVHQMLHDFFLIFKFCAYFPVSLEGTLSGKN